MPTLRESAARRRVRHALGGWRGPVLLAVVLTAIVGATLSACGAPTSARLTRAAGHGTSKAPRLPSALASLAAPGHDSRYYVALGDSLSVGIQPDATGASQPTADGYPDQLDALLRRHHAGLALVSLGCSGETTSTMMHGGICHYQHGSQLAEATAFLRAHRGKVALVTIDIGANDPNSCIRLHSVASMVGCMNDSATGALRNLGTIMTRLRSAAGPRTLMIGMTYYVPELGLWQQGKSGAGLAILAESLAAGLDRQLAAIYRHHDARVADVFAAFDSSDFRKRVSLAGHGQVPRNVAVVCSLTWMCAPAPRGPNVHATTSGYRVIADAFWRAITG